MPDDKTNFVPAAIGIVLAALLLLALWRILRLAIGVALGIVLAVAIVAGGVYLLVRRATSA
jgi:hypothetical protein